ncbi:hypothetical protein [Silvibacterium acidisoli]|uniref:hypothetical protein n=1 Tax=Acidobacteriaceae bacterium ZG23-2 TaxID=2883246 RepID=UPI00406C96EF
MSSTRRILEKQLEVIRGQLRIREPELVAEMEALELAINNLAKEDVSTEYSAYKDAIKAVVAYLQKIGHPATGEVIAATIVAGGWLIGHPRAKANVLASIAYHAIRPIPKDSPIRRVGGGETSATAVIGLAEWEAEDL